MPIFYNILQKSQPLYILLEKLEITVDLLKHANEMKLHYIRLKQSLYTINEHLV